jgi:hypothetical protein
VRHRKIQAGVVTAAMALLLPAVAAADPEITMPPVVSGNTFVGETVTATGYEFKGGQPSWLWVRCDAVDDHQCSAIGGADRQSYEIAAADAGSRLRVVLIVEHRQDHPAMAPSEATDVVKPLPEPTPPPAPSPPPLTPAPVFPAGAVLDTAATHKKKPKMMRPLPIVRVRGRTTPGGARITLLTVEAPRGARISLTCRGRSCPVKKSAHAAKLTRLLRFQRVLAAGTRLAIRVTKPGRIGKYTQIVIRSGKAPTRRDRCLNPGSSKPRRCPSV